MPLSNAVEIGDFCRKEYIYWPLSSNKRLVIDRLIGAVEGPDVLDLGCGEAGLYWALGYVLKAKSLSFYDMDPQAIAALERQLELIAPETLQDRFGDTLDYFRAKGLLSGKGTAEALAHALVEKTADIQVFNFRTDLPMRTFDTVLCVESLHVADSQADLDRQFGTVATLLKPEGRALGIHWRYDQLTEQTRSLIAFGSDGFLNPGETELAAAVAANGLILERMETIDTPEVHNYSTALVFYARKPGDAS